MGRFTSFLFYPGLYMREDCPFQLARSVPGNCRRLLKQRRLPLVIA